MMSSLISNLSAVLKWAERKWVSDSSRSTWAIDRSIIFRDESIEGQWLHRSRFVTSFCSFNDQTINWREDEYVYMKFDSFLSTFAICQEKSDRTDEQLFSLSHLNSDILTSRDNRVALHEWSSASINGKSRRVNLRHRWKRKKRLGNRTRPSVLTCLIDVQSDGVKHIQILTFLKRGNARE